MMLIAPATAAPQAQAASTRAEYVAQVNAICETANGEEDRAAAEEERKFDISRTLDPAKLVKRLRKGAEWFHERYLQIQAAALTQLEQVSPAPGDDALAGGWIANRHLIADLHDVTDRLLAKTSSRLGKDASRNAKRNRKRLDRRLDHALDQGLVALLVDVKLANEIGATTCVRGITLEQLLE